MQPQYTAAHLDHSLLTTHHRYLILMGYAGSVLTGLITQARVAPEIESLSNASNLISQRLFPIAGHLILRNLKHLQEILPPCLAEPLLPDTLLLEIRTVLGELHKATTQQGLITLCATLRTWKPVNSSDDPLLKMQAELAKIDPSATDFETQKSLAKLHERLEHYITTLLQTRINAIIGQYVRFIQSYQELESEQPITDAFKLTFTALAALERETRIQDMDEQMRVLIKTLCSNLKASAVDVPIDSQKTLTMVLNEFAEQVTGNQPDIIEHVAAKLADVQEQAISNVSLLQQQHETLTTFSRVIDTCRIRDVAEIITDMQDELKQIDQLLFILRLRSRALHYAHNLPDTMRMTDKDKSVWTEFWSDIAGDCMSLVRRFRYRPFDHTMV